MLVSCGLHDGRKNISTGLAQSVVSVLFTRTSEVELTLFDWIEVGEGVVEEIRGQTHCGLDIGVVHLRITVGNEGLSLRKHEVATPESGRQGKLG